MKQKEIKALMVTPKEYPKVVTLKTDLDSLQKAVRIVASYQCTTIIFQAKINDKHYRKLTINIKS